MKRLILLGLALVLILCACENTLKIEPTDLTGMSGTVMIDRNVLKVGDSYAIGYENGNIRSDRVRLTWNECMEDNFLCYKLFRNNMLTKTIVDAAMTAAVDSLLMQDHEYDYRLVSILKNGMAVEDTITIKTPQFLSPNGLNYNFLTPTSIYITWVNRAETATGYTIEKYSYATMDTMTYTSLAESYTDNQVDESANYRYRVKATNQYESTDWSPWMFVNGATVASFDFEEDNGDFTTNNPNGWQWGEDAPIGAHSGTKIWGTVLNDFYPNNAFYRLYSPSVEVGEGNVLEFFQKYSMEYTFDGGNVKISNDDGNTWSLLVPYGGYTLQTISSSGEPGFCGVLDSWTQVVFDLSAYEGDTVMFCWTFTSDSSVISYGWYIDDVSVGPETTKELTR